MFKLLGHHLELSVPIFAVVIAPLENGHLLGSELFMT